MADIEERIKVIDTNVILTNPDAVFESFRPKKENIHTTVVIPLYVIGELNKFKTETSERGYNARKASRNIRELKEKYGGNTRDGIPLAENYAIKLDYLHDKQVSQDLNDIDLGTVDKKIIQMCVDYKKEGIETELVTQDGFMEYIAEGMGIEVNPWQDEQVVSSADEINAGWIKVAVPDEIKDEFRKTGKIALENLKGLAAYRPDINAQAAYKDAEELNPAVIFPNHYFFLDNPAYPETHPNDKTGIARMMLGRYNAKNGLIEKLNPHRPGDNLEFPIEPLNFQQRFVLNHCCCLVCFD